MSARADDMQREIILRMTGAERVRLATEMSETVRLLAIAGLRHRNPDWSEGDAQRAYVQQVIAESRRRAPG